MKRYRTGVLVLDAFDLICISFSFGATVAYFNRKWQENKQEDPIIAELKEWHENKQGDPIVAELKQKSPRVTAVNVNGTQMEPSKVPLIRGGADPTVFKIRSLVIENSKFANLVVAIQKFLSRYQKLKSIQIFLAVFKGSFVQFLEIDRNTLARGLALKFLVDGSVTYTQIILLTVPAIIVGARAETLISHPLLTILGPLGLLFGRGIEDIPEMDPAEHCRLLCKYAELYPNQELMIKMRKFSSVVNETLTNENLSIVERWKLKNLLEKTTSFIELNGPLECVEENLSIVERWKLRSLINNTKKSRKQIQYFSEFIKNFPHCDADPEYLVEMVKEKISE